MSVSSHTGQATASAEALSAIALPRFVRVMLVLSSWKSSGVAKAKRRVGVKVALVALAASVARSRVDRRWPSVVSGVEHTATVGRAVKRGAQSCEHV